MAPFDAAGSADAASAGLVMAPSAGDALRAPCARFEFECVGPDGAVKWRDGFDNLVTTAGKTSILDRFLKASGYTAGWFLILKGTGSAAAADTVASHSGWSELTPYAAGTRPAITWGTTSAGANTSSAVAISINATATVAGAGIIDDNTKGGTSAGTLYNVGDFSVARGVASGDTLSVTISLSIS